MKLNHNPSFIIDQLIDPNNSDKILINVYLIEYTKNAEKIVELAARICYSNLSVKELIDLYFNGDKKENNLIEKLYTMGHMTPFENVVFTFIIEEISRSCTHQLVRHRLATYGQRSQRYVNEENFSYRTPKSIRDNKQANEKYESMMYELNKQYKEFINEFNIPQEDARYILPNSCDSTILVTMNLRELFHFFNLRCCMRAQTEIRNVANNMLLLIRESISEKLSMFCGPKCYNTKICTQGKMTCGKIKEISNIYSNRLLEGINDL